MDENKERKTGRSADESFLGWIIYWPLRRLGVPEEHQGQVFWWTICLLILVLFNFY